MSPSQFLSSPRRQMLVLGIGLIVITVLFGGASRLDLVAPILPRIAAVLVIVWICWTAVPVLGKVPRMVWWMWIAILALPVLHLIPLPWSIWTALPGRELSRDIYQAIGEQPWAPLSLTPSRTLNGLLALLPAFAAFLIGLRLDDRSRTIILHGIALLAIASGAIGLFQVAAGPESPLYFYAITNSDSSVGWFSNANHNALFLCAGIVLVFHWLAGQFRDRKRTPWSSIAMAAGGLAMLFLSLPLTQSRAGVLLSLLALGGGISMLPSDKLGLTQRQYRFGLGGVAALAILVIAALTLTRVFGSDGASGLFEDGRVRNVGDFLALGWNYFPFGSGLGSFDPVYRIFEDASAIQLNYLNNAHNEPAQLFIEAGIYGVILMLAFLVGFAVCLFRHIAGGKTDSAQHRLERAALLIVALGLLHSLVDYPLRTGALSMLFGLCAAFVVLRPAVTVGKRRGLALIDYLAREDESGFSFSSRDQHHMTGV
jgi:hypothetical protein